MKTLNRVKTVQKAIGRWTSHKLAQEIGFNPPWIINGKRVFNPSVFDVIQEEIRKEQFHTDIRNALKVKIDNETASQAEQVAYFMGSKKGRKMLATAMLQPIREGV